LRLTTSPVDWYAARAAGILAYLLLSAVVAAGLALAGRETLPRFPRWAVADLHRFFGLLVGVFVAVHVATIAADSFQPFTLQQILVPMTARYRPFWVALGIVGAELLVALAVSNALRSRLPYRFWRMLHRANLVVWAAAAAHGLMSGTDSATPWMTVVYAASIGLVVGIAARRFVPSIRRDAVTTAIATGAGAALAIALLINGVLTVGPRHAATPVAAAASSYQGALRGVISQQNGASAQLVSFAGSGRTASARTANLLVRADLLVAGQQATATSLQIEYLPGGQICSGQVTAAQGRNFDGTCQLADGSTRTVHAVWGDSGSATVTGTITATQ
jgi:methionine sulfoxide reductase heme-binding subunit